MRMFKIINIDSKKDMWGVKDISKGGSVTLGFRDRVLRITHFTNSNAPIILVIMNEQPRMTQYIRMRAPRMAHPTWHWRFFTTKPWRICFAQSTQCKMLANRIYFNLQRLWNTCIWIRKNRMLPSRNSLTKYDVAHTRGVWATLTRMWLTLSRRGTRGQRTGF